MHKLIIFGFLLLVACGDPNKVLKDISFDEVQKLKIENFYNLGAFNRSSSLKVIQLHTKDSCYAEQIFLTRNKENKIEFKIDTLWYSLSRLCEYYDCKKHDLSSQKIEYIYQFLEKYLIDVQSSCELDRIYFKGKGYTYIYYHQDTIPFNKDWKRMSEKWWYSQ